MKLKEATGEYDGCEVTLQVVNESMGLKPYVLMARINRPSNRTQVTPCGRYETEAEVMVAFARYCEQIGASTD